MGKLSLGRTNTRKMTPQWEWRDEMARVLCIHLARGWMVGYYALGWREPILVLRNLGAS
jgi:hypothetical protein